MSNEAKLAAATLSYAMALGELGLRFAGVVEDPELQSPREQKLFYVGTYGAVEPGVDLMGRFLRMHNSPDHTVESFQHVKMDVGAALT